MKKHFLKTKKDKNIENYSPENTSSMNKISNKSSSKTFGNTKHYEKTQEKHTQERHTQNDSSLYCVGIKPLRELLENAPQRLEWVSIRKGQKNTDTQIILDLCSENNIRFNLLEEEALKRLLSSKQVVNSQGVIGKLKEVETVNFEDMLIDASNAPLPLIVALDSVQDPGNLGTLARTLYALGGAGIVMPIHNSASLSIGAKKSAAGALDFLPVARVTNLARALESATKAGYTIYSTSVNSKNTENIEENEKSILSSEKVYTFSRKKNLIPTLNPFYDRLDFPAVLVLGGEDKGVRPLVHKQCDFSLEIPMLRDFDSLNVAQAGAILISYFLKGYQQNDKRNN